MSKFTPEEKLHAVMMRIKTGEPYQRIAEMIGANEISIREWHRNYEVFGEQAFLRQHNAHYSKEFKINCVKYYLSEKGSLNDICRMFKIPSTGILRKWISLYNGYELEASTGGGRIMTNRQ